MWGQQVPDEAINFEWPTEQQFENMEDATDVSIQQIGYKTDGSDFTAFQCTLTNGQTSPIFERDNGHGGHLNTVDIDPEQRITSVSMATATNQPDWLRTLNIIGEDDSTLQSLNGGHDGSLAAFQPREIGENEVLVGIYGVRNVQDHITSFGFIVKTNELY